MQKETYILLGLLIAICATVQAEKVELPDLKSSLDDAVDKASATCANIVEVCSREPLGNNEKRFCEDVLTAYLCNYNNDSVNKRLRKVALLYWDKLTKDGQTN